MKKFNLLVKIQVLRERDCQLTVKAQSFDEAKKIAQQMFDNFELPFDIADGDVVTNFCVSKMNKIINITYEFLEPQELSDKAKCVITAHLETDDGAVATLDFTLTGIELDPEYMTTDRLWELLYGHYELYGITKFEALLEDFVVKFILHLRGEQK